MRYVVVHDTMGVFLGQFLGLSFWTLLASEGQHGAVTFDSPEQAISFFKDQGFHTPIRTVEIEPDLDSIYVSRKALEKLGLPVGDMPHKMDDYGQKFANSVMSFVTNHTVH